MRFGSPGLSGRLRRNAFTGGSGGFGTDVVVVVIFLSGRGAERRRWGARGPLMTSLSRTNDPVLVNQVQDNSAAVIVSTREEGRNIGGKDRSSRLSGYNRDEVIRRTFLGLGLAASRKHERCRQPFRRSGYAGTRS